MIFHCFYCCCFLPFEKLKTREIFVNRLIGEIKNAKKFITKGDKVKFTVKFKGREMQHVELGKDLMKRIIEDTKDIGKVETHPKFEGRQMIMIIQPN